MIAHIFVIGKRNTVALNDECVDGKHEMKKFKILVQYALHQFSKDGYKGIVARKRLSGDIL
jgi:hypothetical protein